MTSALLRCICWVLAANRNWLGLLDTAPMSGHSLLALPVGSMPVQGGLAIIVQREREKRREIRSAPGIKLPQVFRELRCLFVDHKAETQKRIQAVKPMCVMS